MQSPYSKRARGALHHNYYVLAVYVIVVHSLDVYVSNNSRKTKVHAVPRKALGLIEALAHDQMQCATKILYCYNQEFSHASLSANMNSLQ